MIRIGITGQAGFVGTWLYNTIGLTPETWERVPFEDAYFSDEKKMREFVRGCDVIVHLAAMNRHPDPTVIYRTNLELVNRLIAALEAEKATPHVLFSSSTQEEQDNDYGKSKREGRKLLEQWAERNSASFTGLVIPNVYGPFGKPFYNSFIATFCHQLIHGEQPQVLNDSEVKLIYVDSLCRYMLNCIAQPTENAIRREYVPADFTKKVSEILTLLNHFKSLYFEKGNIPALKDRNEVNLFNTFRCYIDPEKFFPVKLVKNTDERGMFVETLRLGTGGQVSFSTSAAGVTRGNHYHTRKIERFTVMRGKARIQLRKVGTEKVLNFDLDGDQPAYVDMPIWYTHNIINTGDQELYTQFWINEWYDPADADTYFEKV